MFHNDRERTLLVVISTLVLLAAPAHAAEPAPLAGAVVRGSSVYTSQQLFDAWRSQLGQPLDRTCAAAVIASVQGLYTRDGYARPEIRADEVSWARGVLELEVFEPQITDVALEGDPGPYADTLERLAARLRNMRPLRRNAVREVLARMRELPGLTVSATTRADEAHRYAYSMAVHTAFDPIDGVARASNRGTEEIGPAFIVGQSVMNGFFGAERLGLMTTAATDIDEYRGGGLFVDVPLSGSGTRLFALAFASRSEPSTAAGEPLDRYTRGRITLRVTHPLAHSMPFDLSLAGTLDAEDFEIRREGAELREERLRVAQLGTRAVYRRGASTQYVAALDARYGIDGLGSGLQATDLTEDSRRTDFLLTRLTLTQLTQFNARWSLRLDALGQHTGYVLPYSERFKIGGERLGRGFEVTEIAGDRGAGAKLELRRAFATERRLFGKPSMYAFYDLGAAWSQDVGGRLSAATAGIGFAVQAGPIVGYLEAAKPLTRPDVEGRKSTTLFAEISVPF